MNIDGIRRAIVFTEDATQHPEVLAMNAKLEVSSRHLFNVGPGTPVIGAERKKARDKCENAIMQYLYADQRKHSGEVMARVEIALMQAVGLTIQESKDLVGELKQILQFNPPLGTQETVLDLATKKMLPVQSKSPQTVVLRTADGIKATIEVSQMDLVLNGHVIRAKTKGLAVREYKLSDDKLNGMRIYDEVVFDPPSMRQPMIAPSIQQAAPSIDDLVSAIDQVMKL